jgi:hypothetical protein
VKKRVAWLITTGLVAGSLAIPGIAAANTTEAIAETGGFSLALPGAGGLTVDVVLDDFGHIESVGVRDPATEPESGEDGDAEELENEHKVRFELEEDGTRIAVMAKNHKLTSKVKAGGLEELSGPHVWSAVLFPDLADETTTVRFTVEGDATGPRLTDVSVEGLPAGADYSVTPDDGDEDEAKVVVTFTWMGFTKVLKIKVEVDDDDDDDDDGPSAVLKIELRAKDRQRLREDSIDPFLGTHEWSGLLCDGTPVGMEYVIGADGAVELVAVSIAEAEATDGYRVKQRGNGFEVRFDDSKARVRVKFGEKDDGSWELKVDAKTTEKCKHERNDDHDEEHDSGKKDKPRRDRDDRDHDEDDDDHDDD